MKSKRISIVRPNRINFVDSFITFDLVFRASVFNNFFRHLLFEFFFGFTLLNWNFRICSFGLVCYCQLRPQRIFSSKEKGEKEIV